MPQEQFRNSYQLKPVSDVSGSVTSSTITPTIPLKLPQTQPATQGTSAFLGYLGSLSADTASAKKEKDTSLNSLMSSYLRSETEGSLTNQAYGAEGGVDTLKGELNDLNAQLMGEQHALQREIERLDKNEEGLTRGAVQDMKRTAERESLRKQADIAVVQMAKQGQYDSAKQIADRAVTAYLEKQKQRNDMLKFIYDENKDAFTTAEKREFETKQKERERELDNEEYRLRAEFDAKIKQSDPQYQLQLQRLRQEVSQVSFGGTLNGKPQTQAQATLQGYADRTAQANQIISQVGGQFTGVESYVGQRVPNIFKSANRQQYEQAQRNFVNAVLRRESGAVISDEEFKNARIQYFPQPGDTPEVIKQKAENRETVINSLYKGANVSRPATPGTVIEDGTGQQYLVGEDGETLTPL